MTKREVLKNLERLKISSMACGMQSDNPTYEKAIEALNIAITALRRPTREQAEKLRGKWENKFKRDKTSFVCSKCGKIYGAYIAGCTNFCPNCGAPMKDEAVDILLKRLEALHENDC